MMDGQVKKTFILPNSSDKYYFMEDLRWFKYTHVGAGAGTTHQVEEKEAVNDLEKRWSEYNKKRGFTPVIRTNRWIN